MRAEGQVFGGDEVKYTESGWLSLVLILYGGKITFHLDRGWKPFSLQCSAYVLWK